MANLVLDYLFNGMSTLYGLFYAKICFICKLLRCSMGIIPSLPLLPGPLKFGGVEPVRILSRGQMKQFNHLRRIIIIIIIVHS